MSKFCPYCGEELVDNAKFCKNCGTNLENLEKARYSNQNQDFHVPTVEKKHTAAIVIGYICAILIPLVGLIISVYLLTRDNSENARKHGKYILIITIIVWVLSFLSIFH
jgi:uncharacterized membrane protein YvbJ